MRILVLGAGAVGGYFGGRLLENGRDVTFLVRPNRAAQLAEHGLQISSPNGNVSIAHPSTVLASELTDVFDIAILTCKSYSLDSAISDLAPGVGPLTMVIPLLNGMRHLHVLEERFGSERVLGGQCWITAALDELGAIKHLRPEHRMTFGPRSDSSVERAQLIAPFLEDSGFDCKQSDDIIRSMWDKWIFISSMAAGTSLMRATVGDINHAPGGTEFLLALLDECLSIAKFTGYELGQSRLETAQAILSDRDSGLASSMMRDMERNAPTEANHIIGDLLDNAPADLETPLLRLAYTHLMSFENRRERLLTEPAAV